MSNDKTEEIHESVRSAYTEALKSSQESTGASSCCAPSTGCCTPPVGTAAKTAGYSQDEVSQFSEASVSSFGCGNPLAFEGVEPGEYTLIAVVADGVHVPLQPWVVDTVTFTVANQ